MPEVKLIQIHQYLSGWVGLDENGGLWRGKVFERFTDSGKEEVIEWFVFESNFHLE